MTKEELSVWSAGFFDGEGYIGIFKYLPVCRVSYSYNVRAAVSNINYESLLLLQSLYGGKVYYMGKNSERGRYYCRWAIEGRPKVTFFLDNIEPYSIVKREQILLAREFIALPKLSDCSNRRGREEKQLILTEYERLYLRFKVEHTGY